MSEIAVTITCKLDEWSNYKTLVIDTVNDVNTNSSSTITTHPIVTGESVADHVYRQPKTMDMSGTFSINGSKALLVDGSGTTLANTQELFEKLQSQGAMCEIVKISGDGKDAKFLRRSNMVLTNIAWTEKINSLGFSFSFTEAMTADVQEYDVDISDTFLPNITEPATLNFTDSLIDWSQVDVMVVKTLLSLELMTEGFLNYVQSLGATALVALGVAAVTAYLVASTPAIAAGIGTAAAALGVTIGGLSATGVGVIVAAGIAAVAVMGYGLYKLIDVCVKASKYKIDQFKHYNDDAKNRAEVQRFGNFQGEIHQNLTQLNDAIRVYQVSANEEQECMLSIDNNYYVFTFTRNNVNNTYSLKITDIEEKERGILSDVSAAPSNYADCTTSNALFRADESGAYVYLINASSLVESSSNDLTNYMILVSQIKPEDFADVVTDIIKTSIMY